jgi:uncharacterized protein involved in tolerance to divalent cations
VNTDPTALVELWDNMSEEIWEVIITAPDADWLAEFARKLVEERLVACGHNIHTIRSISRWDGAIHDERSEMDIRPV